MDVDCDADVYMMPRSPGRNSHLRRLLERKSCLNYQGYEPNPELIDWLRDNCRVLVIGAGGLGCELLKDLALMGFGNIDVIDMDTIDLSNLNRQFLFRPGDVGKPKAEVAANFINKRIGGVKVTGHYKKIQDFDSSFYESFHLVVCGLDSIIARRWINGMLLSLLQYNDGILDESTVIPMVDGGTEGFKGNVRVILPGKSACIECTLDLYPPQINFPLCTIAHTPRLPEHCIEYVRVLLWNKDNPFGGEGTALDGDDPEHVTWVYERSLERAKKFKIEGITYRLTQGVVKRIIPAVASTNAIVAAACAGEVFKLATSSFTSLNNYMVFSDTEGVYTYCYEAEKKEDCIACSLIPRPLIFLPEDKLQQVVDHLCLDGTLQMKSPSITTEGQGGGNKTLYMSSVPLEQVTRPNLKKSLTELEILDGQVIDVTDVTSPTALRFVIKYDVK